MTQISKGYVIMHKMTIEPTKQNAKNNQSHGETDSLVVKLLKGLKVYGSGLGNIQT